MNPKKDTSQRAPLVRLGELIEECDERNYDLCVKLSQGISNLKFFQAPKQVAENSRSDKIVRKGQFAYNRATTRNGEKISIAYREGEDCTVSSAYGVFRIVSENVLDPRYLMLFFNRSEFDRFARWRSEGSAHEFFTFEMMQNVQIPLPSIEVQRDLVAIYEGCRKIVDENLALVKHLERACHAFVVDCKSKYPPIKLGEFIEECDERNYGNALTLDDVRGISNEKKFIATKANMEGVSLSPYKIVRKGWFAYVPVTSRNGEKISLALYTKNTPGIVSSSYIVFRSKDETVLLPEYLYLLFNRAEFDRYARFNSWGSARETFDFSEMQNVQVPLPPREIQESIVLVCHCLEEAKRIVRETRERMEALCPALVQKAAHAA